MDKQRLPLWMTSASSSLSSLLRSSTGTVTEDDLDRQVAELILKEAKKKAEKYGQTGIRAYISSNLCVSFILTPRAFNLLIGYFLLSRSTLILWIVASII